MEVFYIFSKKIFLMFWQMKLSSPKIKKFWKGLSELKKLKKATLKKFLIFRDMELFSFKLKNSYIFLKKTFLIFQEGIFKT